MVSGAVISVLIRSGAAGRHIIKHLAMDMAPHTTWAAAAEKELICIISMAVVNRVNGADADIKTPQAVTWGAWFDG